MAELARVLRQHVLRRASHPLSVRTSHSSSHLHPRSFINIQRCLQQQFRSIHIPHTSSQNLGRARYLPRRIPRSLRRFQSTQTEATASPENLSLTQRMRKLSREYGYSALGVYLALSAIDLPFCYVAVSYLGAERVGRWEHAILSYVKDLMKWPMGLLNGNEVEKVDEGVEWVKSKVPLSEVKDSVTGEPRREKRLLEEDDTYILEDHGVKEAEKANTGDKAGARLSSAIILTAYR